MSVRTASFVVLIPKATGYAIVGIGTDPAAAVADATKRTDHGPEFLARYVVVFLPPLDALAAGARDALAAGARAVAASIDPLFDAAAAASRAAGDPPPWRAALNQLASAQGILRDAGSALAALTDPA